MKKFIITNFVLISMIAHGQCDQATAWVFSLSPGYAQSGVILGMEAGLWPVAGKVGVLAGPVMYDQQYTVKDKAETFIDIDFACRLIYKLTKLGSSSPQLVTLFATARGNLGVSYRSYISIGDYQLLGLEPFISTKTGPGLNVIFTARL